MPLSVYDTLGGWRTVLRASVMDAGTWRRVVQAWVRDGSTWHPVFAIPVVVGTPGNNRAEFEDGIFVHECPFVLGGNAQSAKVERSINGGPWALVNVVNTTGAGTSGPVFVGEPDSVQFRVTPYAGLDATGDAGDTVESNIV